jgi:hypothetical protein
MYVPGKATPITDANRKQASFIPTVYRRKLGPEEFAYYFAFLTTDEVSEPVKAALAIVLKADLIRLYKADYSAYADKLIEDYVQYYEVLTPEQKSIADGEIHAFEMELARVINYNKYNNWLQKESLDWFQSARMWDAKNQYKKSKQEYEDEQAYLLEVERQKAELLKNRPVYLQRYNDYVRENFMDYLASILSIHKVNWQMGGEKSDMEFMARNTIIGMIEEEKLQPYKSLEMYHKLLNDITSTDSMTMFKIKLNFRKAQFTQHPLMRILA